MKSDARRARVPRLVKGGVALAVMAGIALTPVVLALSSTPAGAQPLDTTQTSTPSSSPNPAVVGQEVTLSATVTADDGGTPTGTVTFSDPVETSARGRWTPRAPTWPAAPTRRRA